MRSPSDMRSRPMASPRRRIALIVGIVVLLVVLFSLRSLAILWTDELWFSSERVSSVFTTLLEIKVLLGLIFGLVFAIVLFVNLLLADRFGARDLSFEAEDEVMRRFQEIVRPYARRVYAAVSLVAGFFAGLTAMGQWQDYLLFANSRSFHREDPLFHKDIGFYVFQLPFLRFIVDWALASLVVIIVITTVFHYLNGGIRPQRASERFSPQVKAHLSVLLAVVAIGKAAGYVVAKWQLVVSTNGYVNGAGYADVHARIPALTILSVLSLCSAAILLYNIRARGWSLPILAVGLWVFVAVVIGYIYPSALQAFKVNPAQGTLESSYIQRNIDATRHAYDLTDVHYHAFAASTSITAKQVAASAATLANIRLWDPASNISLETIQRLQRNRAFYNFASIAVDRYLIDGKVTPVLIGTRQINSNSLPASTWVNEHLYYTHGIGVALVPANKVISSTGYPKFAIGDVPPKSQPGLPTILQPDVYFGINLPGWVVADSKVRELDYQSSSGGDVTSHYAGGGGVEVGGLLRRAAFALRFGDLNLLISDQVTGSSRIIFVRDVLSMAQKAAPFITWDTQPYPVVADGGIYYVVDGFTTSDEYPYSQNADTVTVGESDGLPGSYNYVRNSVKMVVNAYTGKMSFYAADPSDPILQAYRAAFPGMFQPMSSMPPAIGSHLRYPAALFAIQTAILGRYHITNATNFYSASDQWEVTPTTGAGSPTQTLAETAHRNAQGVVLSTTLTPMSPQYEVAALPNSSTQQLLLTTAYIPAGSGQTLQSLAGFATVTSNLDDYGEINVYTTPRGGSATGPLQADADIEANETASRTITPLDQHGSHVLLGNNLLVPLNNSVLYIRPMYVTSSANALPQLKDVITVFNTKVGIAPTLSAAVAQVLGGSSTHTAPTKGKGEKAAAEDLAAAEAAYSAAQSALSAGDLGKYQTDIAQMDADIQAAQSALSH